jgi:hypothetical protein
MEQWQRRVKMPCVPRGFGVSLRRSIILVKKAADERKRLIQGDDSVTRNCLSTGLSTGSVHGPMQAKYWVAAAEGVEIVR